MLPFSRTSLLIAALMCAASVGAIVAKPERKVADERPAVSLETLVPRQFGDWREEVIWRTSDNLNLRIYTTTIPATNRIYTLMHDPQYRLAIAWQNVGYNQPPHLGYYIGPGMAKSPLPEPIGERARILVGVCDHQSAPGISRHNGSINTAVNLVQQNSARALWGITILEATERHRHDYFLRGPGFATFCDVRRGSAIHAPMPRQKVKNTSISRQYATVMPTKHNASTVAVHA